MTTTLRVAGVWLLLSVSGCAWLNDQQRLIIYRPTPSTATASPTLPAVTEIYFLEVPQNSTPQRIAVWWMPQPDAQAPALLYLHGTFRNLQGNQHKIASLYAAGFSVLAVDYRGWGQSTAIIPSEQTILQDAHIAWQELVRREAVPGKRVIYGHSMGSGVAVAMASQLPYPASYGGVILESAFTSFADIAHQAGFWASVLQSFSSEKFASIDKIAKVHAPLLMIHGEQDDTIPIQLGEQLFAAANPPKQWLSISGGHHSDLDEVGKTPYQQALHTFLSKYLAPSQASPSAATGAPTLQAQ
ncbi:MAG TPA: alpha/beta fold hydrolase [Rhodoferax sp.]